MYLLSYFVFLLTYFCFYSFCLLFSSLCLPSGWNNFEMPGGAEYSNAKPLSWLFRCKSHSENLPCVFHPAGKFDFCQEVLILIRLQSNCRSVASKALQMKGTQTVWHQGKKTLKYYLKPISAKVSGLELAIRMRLIRKHFWIMRN